VEERMKYTVQVWRTVLEETTITVEAENREEAHELARTQANEGPDSAWEHQGTLNDGTLCSEAHE
jgi:hypothetical protein